MNTKLLLAVLVVAGSATTTVMAASAVDYTPGQINQVIKGLCGTPGQQVDGLPANEFAAIRNDLRKLVKGGGGVEATLVRLPPCLQKDPGPKD
jgi:hypothetical protein